MIDFDEEIAKYKPILMTEDIEKSVREDGFDDIMDMLEGIKGKRGL